jgi:hypothetical protein
MRGSSRRRFGRDLAALPFALLLAGAAWAAVVPPRRAILVSFDGLGGQDLWRHLAAGELSPDGFARAAREGFSAERLVVVTPSRTAVSHAAISGGAPPSATGIVENWMHPPGSPPGTRVSGFDVDSRVETLWEAATRQGRRVASLGWPGTFQSTPRSTTPIALRYVEAPAGVLWEGPHGPLADAHVALPLGVDSYAPPKTIRVDKEDRDKPAALTFVAIDSTDDGRRAYDQLLAFDAHGALAARVRPGEWFSATERRDEGGERDVVWGRWGKLLELAPDLSRIALYLGGAARTYASPDDFRRTLDRDAGFWPEAPDPVFLKRTPPDTASFVEEAGRYSRFFVRAFEVARRRGDWSLLLAYQPLVDEGAHPLLLVDPSQPGYSAARAAQYAAAMRQILAAADRAAADYMRFADEGDVVFVSDHGHRAVSRAFLLREALKRKGWLKTNEAGTVIAPDSPIDAATGGGTGFVYVNRSAPGMTEQRAAALVREIAQDLRGRRDPTGVPLFASVLLKGDLGTIGLDAPEAGDLVVITAGVNVLSNGLLKDANRPLFEDVDSPGQHGFGPDPALDGIFFHVGEGIAREHVPAFREVDVAARIAERLGFAFGKPR